MAMQGGLSGTSANRKPLKITYISADVKFLLKDPGSLKVPKREIFLTELSILRVPIWIGNLRAEPKKTFV
jgi:hypothetical protein